MLSFIACVLAVHKPDDLIASASKALFVTAKGKKGDFILKGAARYSGSDSAFVIRFSDDGRYLRVADGPVGESFGFDGATAWTSDRAGATFVMSFADLDKQEAISLALSDQWLVPGKTYKTGVNGDHVEVAVGENGLVESIALDPATSLPTKATFTTSDGPVSIALSHWTSVGGRMLPFHTEITDSGETDTYDVRSARESGSSPAEVYGMPKWTPRDTQFDGAIPAEIESKRARSGHILVHPRINGKDVGWFILDSGAGGMILDPSTAKDLGLKTIGEMAVTGVGGTIKADIWRVDTTTLGPITIHNLPYGSIDLKSLSVAFGVPVAGIVGSDLFRRAIVEVSLTPLRIAIDNPATYTLSSGTWQKALFDNGNIAVQAKAEGEEGWYRIDTGDSGILTFHSPYVVKHHVLDSHKTLPVKVGGVGGSQDARLGVVKSFELGGVAIANARTVFYTGDSFGFADPYLAGNVGQGVLKSFNTVFDFNGSRIAFLKH